MYVRRFMFRAQPALTALLPLWLLFGWGFFGGGGWEFLLVILGAVLAFAGLLVLDLLVFLRPLVRGAHRLSWRDVALFAVPDALLVWLGFYGPGSGWVALAAVIAWSAAVSIAVWSIIDEGRRAMDAAAAGLRGARFTHADSFQDPTVTTAIDVGELTVTEVRDEERGPHSER